MIQYPKQTHITLPSVESWGTNMNIQRDPPKALWTRKIDKVSQTQEITRMIGEGGGDRICEMIKVYPRGINPHVAVSYSNYGTNGGQNRQTTNAGTMGRNKASSDGRSALTGQAKLPIPLINYGAFRPPVLRQEELMPLSRQPRTSTQAWTQRGFANYVKKTECPKPKDLRQIVDEPIRTNVRPTKTITKGQLLIEPFEIRQVIANPIKTPGMSGIRSMDRTLKNNSDVNGRVKDALEGNIVTNLIHPIKGGKLVRDINPNKYVTDVTYSNVTVNKGARKITLLKETKGNLPVNYDHINVSASAGINIPNATPLTDNYNYELNRPIPSHQRVSNKSSNIHRRIDNQTHRVLDRNRPVASAMTSMGKGFGSDLYMNGSRDKKLIRKIKPGGMPGKATAPRHSMTRHTQFKSNQNKMNLIHKSSATLGSRY
jgi:hypothetical protein